MWRYNYYKKQKKKEKALTNTRLFDMGSSQCKRDGTNRASPKQCICLLLILDNIAKDWYLGIFKPFGTLICETTLI